MNTEQSATKSQRNDDDLLPVGLVYARAAPRLAIATVYWSVATLVASPLIIDAPDWLMLAVLMGGLALGVGLPLDYWRRPWVGASSSPD